MLEFSRSLIKEEMISLIEIYRSFSITPKTIVFL